MVLGGPILNKISISERLSSIIENSFSRENETMMLVNFFLVFRTSINRNMKRGHIKGDKEHS